MIVPKVFYISLYPVRRHLLLYALSYLPAKANQNGAPWKALLCSHVFSLLLLLNVFTEVLHQLRGTVTKVRSKTVNDQSFYIVFC